jgi:hypothetical protein
VLPVTLAVETYSNHRIYQQGTPDSLELVAHASDTFTIFVNTTPAFPSGVGLANSLGSFSVSGQISPKIPGVSLATALGVPSAEVYFGNSIPIFGIDLNVDTYPLYAEGQIVDNQAYPTGLFLEMRVGDFSIYLDQWQPHPPPVDVWEDINKYDLFCEV